MRWTASGFILSMVFAGSTAHAQEDWTANQWDVSIPVRDGKTLSADIYLPPKTGKYPTVLIQTPYNKTLMRGMIADGRERKGEAGRGAEGDLAVLRDRDHYAYVVVDWRGFFASRSAAEGARRPIKRGIDGYDCIEWIAQQPWSDGKVGTWGGSALGRIQLDTAVEKPPHLVCAAPLIAPLGQRYEDYYEGGVLLESHVNTLDRLGFGVGNLVRRFPNSDAPAWTAARLATYKPDQIEVPCLFITGWWDNFPGSILSTFDDIRSRGHGQARQSKLIVGPWSHVSIGIAHQGDLEFPKAAKASGEAARQFFDWWLRDVKNDWDRVADCRVWQIGEEKWIEESPRGSSPRGEVSVGLGAGGVYRSDPSEPSPTLGGANLPPLKHGPTDHSALDSRQDQHVWKISQQLRINGISELDFEATVDRENCDFMARLCEVRNGKPYLLTDAARRIKTRPGHKTHVKLAFQPTAITTGELRVYLSSTNWPRYGKHDGVINVTVHEGATLKVRVLK